MEKLCGEIMSLAAVLNCFAGIDVFVCLHGNTDVIAVTVEDNKTLIYSRKEFIANLTNVKQIKEDVRKMIDYAGKNRRTKFRF